MFHLDLCLECYFASKMAGFPLISRHEKVTFLCTLVVAAIFYFMLSFSENKLIP